jgi:ankyrin repeat protein
MAMHCLVTESTKYKKVYFALFDIHIFKKIIKFNMELNDWNCMVDRLIDACFDGHLEHVETLLRAGAPLNVASARGFFPLSCACCEGRTDVVKMLLRAGANKNQVDYDGRTPLHHACSNGHAEVTEVLLHAGVDKEATSDSGCTALHQACYNGHADVVRVLLRAGVVVKHTKGWGRSALHMACAREQWEIVKMLLYAGAIISDMPLLPHPEKVYEIAESISQKYRRDACLFALGIGDASCPMSLLAGFPHIVQFIVAVVAPPAILKREPVLL